LVLGPNYNLPGDEERGARAYRAILRARTLDGGVAAKERDLIGALSRRYGDDGKETPARDRAYADAMRGVAHRYPDNADVQVLFAESLMDEHPWQLWSGDGKPNFDTVEIVATLEAVLKKHPNHLGANITIFTRSRPPTIRCAPCRVPIGWPRWLPQRAIWCTCRRIFISERAAITRRR
jgi:hypothetical protein